MRRLLALAVCLAAPVAVPVAVPVAAQTPVGDGAANVDPVVPGPNPVAATPAAARLAAAEQSRQLAEASPLAEVPFRSVGPTVMSGRVAAVAGKPGDPSAFYVAYASGGLWRTANGGNSFTPVFDHMPTITLGDVAVDWRDPEGDGPTVWVGTGESNSSRSSYAGTGVYRSTDGGDSWAHLGLAETQHVGSIVLGDQPGTAWVAAIGHLYSPNPERGVFRTTDGGASWTKTLFVDDDTGAIDLVRAGDGRLYASTWTRSRRAWDFREGGPGSAIWASDDDGATWTRLSTEGSGFPTAATVGRIGLDVHPSGVVYAVVDNQARRPADPDAEEPTLTSAALATMTREEFLAVAEDDLNAFLDANNVPYSYTAESILEDVREGRISAQDLVDFLGDANAALFDTPVVGAQVYRSDDRGRSWQVTHEGTLDDLFYSYGYYFSIVRVDPNDVDRLYVLGVPLVGSVDGGATWQRADAPSRPRGSPRPVARRASRPATCSPATTAARTSRGTTARRGISSTRRPSASSTPSRPTTPSPTTSTADCRTTASGSGRATTARRRRGAPRATTPTAGCSAATGCRSRSTPATARCTLASSSATTPASTAGAAGARGSCRSTCWASAPSATTGRRRSG